MAGYSNSACMVLAFYFQSTEEYTIVTNGEEAADTNVLAEAIGLKYPVRLSPELSKLLKPNPFLAEMGIRYDDRIKTILGLLKGSLIPKNGGTEDTIPDKGIVIPLAIAKGPYIREELISIRAELTDDDGKAEILLTAILAQE
jgi:hypothetical protein